MERDNCYVIRNALSYKLDCSCHYF